MGKGDKKTKRGKIVNHSYGVRRQRKNKPAVPHVATVAELPEPVLEVVKKAAKPVVEEAAKKTKKVAGDTPKPKKTKKDSPAE
jgi:ribosomal small subunit protein bTHX